MEFTSDQRTEFLERMRVGILLDRPPPPKRGLENLYVLNPTMRGQDPSILDGEEIWPCYVALDPSRDAHIRDRMGITGKKIHRGALGQFVVFTDVSFIVGYITTERRANRATMYTCDFDYVAATPIWGVDFAKFCESIVEHRLDHDETLKGLRTYMTIVNEMAGVEFTLESHQMVDVGANFKGFTSEGGSA